MIASEWAVVLDYGVRKGLCEEGIFELSSEQHKPDHEGASLEKKNLGRENSQANALGADISLARSRIRKKVGVAGAEWAKRVGETHSITWHLKFLPATSATKTYHLHLQQIWTLSHGSVFYFCFTFSWQAKNMNKKDKRLKIMNEILNGIKVRSRGYSWPFSVCNDGRSWS